MTGLLAKDRALVSLKSTSDNDTDADHDSPDSQLGNRLIHTQGSATAVSLYDQWPARCAAAGKGADISL